METNFKSRKFLLSLAVLIIASVLVYFSAIGETVYGTIVCTLITTYIAGNVAQKAVTKETK